MDKQETRQTLLEVGTRYLWEHGYHHSGLNDILGEAQVPKGSFYYYFNSKEDFGLQSLDFFASNLLEGLRSFLEDEAFPPLERLRRYFETSAEDLEAFGFRQGCLIGNFGQEMSDQNERIRQKVDELLSLWSSAIADCLRQAQAQNELREDFDVHELADFCLNSWQGAILRMKVVKTTAPLNGFIHHFFDILLK
jgi:TetR/AcrR family transcriptional regulator, transcriptional repressor for nem operon